MMPNKELYDVVRQCIKSIESRHGLKTCLNESVVIYWVKRYVEWKNKADKSTFANEELFQQIDLKSKIKKFLDNE